jgi:hypothetical protein
LCAAAQLRRSTKSGNGQRGAYSPSFQRTAHDSQLELVEISSYRRPTFVEAKHRSDRQQVSPITRPLDARQAEPTTPNEWGPAERLVSGAAAQSAPSPFVDVQSVPRCVAAAQNTGLEMKKTPQGQVLLLELEMVGIPCSPVRRHVLRGM